MSINRHIESKSATPEISLDNFDFYGYDRTENRSLQDQFRLSIF